MYKWVDGRKFPGSKSLPVFTFNSKNFNPFIKSRFELVNFNQLPVIKEEEGYVSDRESEAPQKIFKNLLDKKSYSKNDSVYSSDSNRSFKYVEKTKETKPVFKLPPLVNINCLMNTEIKQTQAIWNTNFGKRLINGKNIDENFNEPEIKEAITVKKSSKKLEDCHSSKSLPKQKNLKEKNNRNGEGDKVEPVKIKSNKKKSKKINKHGKVSANKKSSQEKNFEEKISQTPSIEKISETSSRKSLDESSTASSISKGQRFLTECVKSILDNTSSKITCEHCDLCFLSVEDLFSHRKQHETQKEICLLCERVFYNSNEFIEHLLTHEGVDRFSCKKCKKYFPNERKCKKHFEEFHFIPPSVPSTPKAQSNSEFIENWLPKFECKRCKIEFDSKKAQEAHKKNHIKKDLAGAYLLSSKKF